MKFQDLLAYQKSFSLAMKIFEITKRFPKEEMYSLTDQIRRSSRSVSANISLEFSLNATILTKVFTTNY
jgi:four helix bundle protein